MSFCNSSIGRKPSFLLAVILLTIACLGAAVAPNFYVLSLFTACKGFFIKGLMYIYFCLAVEMVGPSKRPRLAFLRNVLRPFSFLFCAIIFWYTTNWRVLAFLVAVPHFLFPFFYFVTEESPLWLINNKKREEAVRLLKMFKHWDQSTAVTDADIDLLEIIDTNFEHASGVSNLYSNKLRKQFFLTLFFIIVVSGMGNSSVMYYAEKLSGDFGTNFSLFTITHILSYLLGYYFIHRIGSIRLMRLDLVLATLCFTMVGVDLQHKTVPYRIVRTTAAHLGKLFILNAINSGSVFAAEMYPTTARNLIIGFMGIAPEFGRFLAPYVLFLGKLRPLYNKVPLYIPYMIFSFLQTIAFCLTFTLPPKPESPLQTFEDFDKHLAISKGVPVPPKITIINIEGLRHERDDDEYDFEQMQLMTQLWTGF